MKLLFASLLSTLLLDGCASDTPPGTVVEEHLQRGASGQGELGPINRGPDDPFINSRVGDTSPGHQ